MSRTRIALLCLLVGASCKAPEESVGVVRSAATTTCTSTLLPTWPTNWRSMLCHGAPAYDPAGDANPAIIDAVGSTAFPSVQSAMDANFLYLRMRTNLSVGPSTCTCGGCVNSFIEDAHGWGYDFDTDGNPSTYEFQLLLNGANNAAGRTLEFNENLVQAGAVDSPNEKAESPACIYAGADADARVRVDTTNDGSNIGGNCDFFITLAFPLAELAAKGYNMKAARLVWAGSSAQAQNLSGDLVCSPENPTLKDPKGDPTPLCFGACCTQNSDCTPPAGPTTNTTLTLPLLAIGTTATVVSTAGYPTSGILVIDSENIQYTGITGTTFTGLTRGVRSSTAAIHLIGAAVDNFFGEDFCNTTTGVCECSTAPDSCASGQFCDPILRACRPSCTSAAPQGGACSTAGNMTLCCDDGNTCTTNACTGGKCVFAPTNQGLSCDDFNNCTGSAGTETATCNNGVCGSLVVTCTDDMLACTSDICQSLDLACVHPTRSSGTLCRAAAPGGCDVAETCDGTTTTCPANGLAPNGTACSDGNACTGGETCQTGVCGAPTTSVSCNMPPACQSTVGGTCNVMTGACSYPTAVIGQPCTSGAGGTCNCVTAVCNLAGGAPGVCAPINTCGNGTLEVGEGCDDGNLSSGDGCNASCKVEDTRACNAAVPGLIGSLSCASGLCDMTGGAPGLCKPSNVCSNGILEAGEGCDDSNLTNGDNCNSMCKIETGRPCNASMPGATGDASCASGVCNATGGAPGVCAPINTCGNGKLEAAEGCDDGNLVNGDGCNSMCKVEDARACNATAPGLLGNPSCASGLCNVTAGAPGVCAPPGACGNSALEAGEGCDDGNLTDGDGCNSMCRIDTPRPCNGTAPGLIGGPSCASGVCNLAGGAPGVCAPINNCGNGLLETGEGCDDGNLTNGDSCNSMCKVEDTRPCNATNPGLLGGPSCASGICNATGGAPGVCAPLNTCGNSLLEVGEGCDDGNVASGDSCDSMCKVETTRPCNAILPGLIGNPSCASGVCNVTGGAPGVCAPINTCGNSVLEAGEGCDDGNLVTSDGCNAICRVEDTRPCNAAAPGLMGSPSCASGLCDMTGGAPGVCKPTNVCGNAVLESGEGCDDSNLNSGDGCDSMCKIETTRPCNANVAGATGNASCASGLCNATGGAPGVCASLNTCGNSVLETGEGCDDGNLVTGDGCNATCRVEDTRPCNGFAPGLMGGPSCASGLCDMAAGAPGICKPINSCSNGVLESGEGCDDSNLTTGDGCNAMCKIETPRPCNADVAGATGNASCASGVCNAAGGAPGVCAPIDTCGNGKLEAGEGCDDGNLTAGDGCNATCRVEDARACNATAPGLVGNPSCASGVCNTAGGAPGVCAPANTCGNGKLETGEGCDDGNLKSGDGCNATCKVENTRPCNGTAPGLTGDTSCESGQCDTTGGAPGVCVPPGCNRDSDCTGGLWCNITLHTCTPKLPNGDPLPRDQPHSGPTLDGKCTTAAAMLVCLSGVCDTVDDKCGLTDGGKPCTVATGPVVCRSGVCNVDGSCGERPIVYGFSGGGCTCSVGASSSGQAWATGLLLLLALVMVARTRRTPERL